VENFAERELEDYIWRDPYCLKDYMHHALVDEYAKPIVKLGRQVKCGTGIIDLLFQNHTDLYIIELKNKRAGDREFGQLARYADHVSRRVSYMSVGSVATNRMYGYMQDCIEVHKVLIATEFDDIIVGSISNTCHLIQVEKINDVFAFSSAWSNRTSMTNDLQNALLPFHQYVTNMFADRRECEMMQETKSFAAQVKEACIFHN